MNTTATMPQSKMTYFMNKSEYSQVFKRDNTQDFGHEPLHEAEAHSKLSHEGEWLGKFREAGKAMFAKEWERFASYFEKLSGKIKAAFNNHSMTSSDEKTVPNQYRHYNEFMAKETDEEIKKPIEPIIEREAI